MTEIDYDYHNTPEYIQKRIEDIGGHSAILRFCQLNRVEVVQGDDYNYMCFINGEGSYCTELDGYSAMVIGIYNYTQRYELWKRYYTKTLLSTDKTSLREFMRDGPIRHRVMQDLFPDMWEQLKENEDYKQQ